MYIYIYNYITALSWIGLYIAIMELYKFMHFIQIFYFLMSLHFQYIVCPVNEYVGGSAETCQPCPAMSSSPGGVVRVCPCMDGYGRVNESDPSLPCVGELVGD